MNSRRFIISHCRRRLHRKGKAHLSFGRRLLRCRISSLMTASARGPIARITAPQYCHPVHLDQQILQTSSGKYFCCGAFLRSLKTPSAISAKDKKEPRRMTGAKSVRQVNRAGRVILPSELLRHAFNGEAAEFCTLVANLAGLLKFRGIAPCLAFSRLSHC